MNTKQTFAKKVKLPVEMINYRALEQSMKGIEKQISEEPGYGRRRKLHKVRRSIKTILSEL